MHTSHFYGFSARVKISQCVTRRKKQFPPCYQTRHRQRELRKMSRKSREREREHFVWEEVMEIHDGKNRTEQKKKKKKERKKKKRQRKIISESSVRIKSICHHILLTFCNRCSLNVMLSATDTPQSKQIITPAAAARLR